MEDNMAIVDEINKPDPEVPIPTKGYMTVMVDSDSGELKTAGGLIVPEHMKDTGGMRSQLPVIGRVLAIGTGCKNAVSEYQRSVDNYEEATKVRVGDLVTLNTYDQSKYTIVYPPEYNAGNIKYYFIIIKYTCINAILLSGRQRQQQDGNKGE